MADKLTNKQLSEIKKRCRGKGKLSVAAYQTADVNSLIAHIDDIEELLSEFTSYENVDEQDHCIYCGELPYTNNDHKRDCLKIRALAHFPHK